MEAIKTLVEVVSAIVLGAGLMLVIFSVVIADLFAFIVYVVLIVAGIAWLVWALVGE